MNISKEDIIEPYIESIKLKYDSSSKYGFYLSFTDGFAADTKSGANYLRTLKNMGYVSDKTGDSEFFDIVSQRLKDLGFNEDDFVRKIAGNGRERIYLVPFNNSQKKNGMLQKFIIGALENTDFGYDEYTALRDKRAPDSVMFAAMIDEDLCQKYMAKKVIGRTEGNELSVYLKKPEVFKAFSEVIEDSKTKHEYDKSLTSCYDLDEADTWHARTSRHIPARGIIDERYCRLLFGDHTNGQ